MATKRKTTKRRASSKRKYPVDAGIESMNRTMQVTTQTMGNVAIAGMTLGLASAVIGGMGK